MKDYTIIPFNGRLLVLHQRPQSQPGRGSRPHTDYCTSLDRDSAIALAALLRGASADDVVLFVASLETAAQEEGDYDEGEH